MGLTSCHPSSAYNLEEAPRVWKTCGPTGQVRRKNCNMLSHSHLIISETLNRQSSLLCMTYVLHLFLQSSFETLFANTNIQRGTCKFRWRSIEQRTKVFRRSVTPSPPPFMCVVFEPID